MFSFIDSASDHGAALSHFHSYALFFLILVIVFVVWLLKMVLKFVVFEKDLNLTRSSISRSEIPHINYFFWSLVNFAPHPVISQSILDLFVCVLLTKTAGKVYYSYGLKKTIYPDQGKTVNVFPIFPSLIFASNKFYRLNSTGALSSLYKLGRPEFLLSVLTVFRASLHNIPFLFPYERVEINSHGPYASVEAYLTINAFVSTNYLALKHIAIAKYLTRFFVRRSRPKWRIRRVNFKKAWGLSAHGNKFFYKSYSVFTLPFSLFADFYGSDSRMFFYMFFQHVRHRLILEWIWTCLPALILLLLLYPSLILLYAYDRPYITRPYLTFKAIGHQWYWSYEYSDFVTSLDEEVGEHVKFDSYMIHQDDLEMGGFRLLEVDRRVVLPIGVCMRLVTTSSDVLHSWAVPALGVKIDAVPGRLNQFWIVADRPGTFYGQCSELCGVNHGFMPIAVEGAEFLDFFKAISAALRS